MRAIFRKLYFASLLLTLFALPAFAQDETPKEVNDQNRGGDLPFSSSIGTEVESVDASTGHLSVRIPFVSLPGRRMNYSFGIRYDSGYWVTALRGVPGTYRYYWKIEKRTYVPDTGLGWQTTQPRLTSTQWREGCGGSLFVTHKDSFIYHDPNGGAHSLDLESQAGGCQWPSGSGVDQGGYVAQTPNAPDTSGAGVWASNWWTVPTQKLRLADGTLLVSSGVSLADNLGNSSFNYEVLYGGYTDPNGNQKTEYPGGVDTLGRSIVTQQSGTNQVLFKVYDSSGTLQTYTVNYAPITLSTHFNITNTTYGLIIENTETRNVVTSVVLPNGRSYLFQYETNGYGGISRIDFPTGAYATYVWDTWSDALRTYRYVTSRTLTVNGQSYTWTFARGAPIYGHPESYPVTVTDPLLNQTAYIADHGSITSAKIYTGSATGTPLRQYTIDYMVLSGYRSTDDTGRLPIRITTTLEDGQTTKKEEYDYDNVNYNFQTCWDTLTCAMNGAPDNDTWFTTRGNVTEIREFDWGQGVPGGLLRRTKKTYLHDSNSSYLALNIVNKVLTENICNGTVACAGTGDQAAQTQYEYDNYLAGDNPLLSTTNAAQHDYTNYPYTFTTRGNATRVKHWRNTDGALITTTYQYDDLGNIRAIKDPLSHPTTYDYTDSFANTACPPPTGKNGQAYVSTVTNALSQQVKVVRYPCTGLVQAHKDQNDINASRAGTTYTYDLFGRPTQKNTVDGGQTTTAYNDVPPVSATTTTKINSTQSLVSTIITDGLARATQSILCEDGPTCANKIKTDTTYDSLGRTLTASNPYRSTSDPTYGITTNVYDVLGRTCVVVPPDGTAVSGNSCPASAPANDVFTSYAGVATTVMDQAGKKRKSVSDALGRLTQVLEDPSGLNYETDYQYDILGNLVCAVQKGTDTAAFTTCAAAPAAWRPRSFTYNSLSQLLTAANPESGTITYAYNTDGAVATKIAPAPNQTGSLTVTTTYSSDSLHRVTQKSYSDGITPTIKYGFDAVAPSGCTLPALTINNGIGKRTGMCDSAGSEAWSYDITAGTGWKITDARTTNGVPKSTIVQYNLVGSAATLTYPSSRIITYAFDAAARPVSAIDSTGPINYATAATYAPPGGLASLTNGASTVSTLFYNNRLQPCRISVKNTGTAPASCADAATGNVLDFTYCFNSNMSDPDRTAHNCSASATLNNGNVAQIVNRQTTARSQNFKYDALNRIQSAYTEATTGQYCWDEQFGYDPWGNLLTIGRISGYSCSNEELLNSPATTKNQISGNTYDSAGNLIAVPAIATYTYNAENQLTATAGVTYMYDGDGKRVQKSSSKLYWYGMGSDPLDETDLTGVTTNSAFNEYIFFGGKRIARRDSTNTVNYYLADHLGTARIVANSSGTPVDDSDFYPFGGERIVASSSGNHYKFTGKERDPESGLDNFGARYDSSSLGRFMSPDPENIGAILHDHDPQSWNGYAYARNNPLLYTDPDGRNHFVCDKGGKNCADLTNEQYDQFRRDSPNLRVTPSGDIYTRNDNGTETKTGHEYYYDERVGQALYRAGGLGETGVKWAMIVTAPNYLVIGGVHFFLGGSMITSLGITPRFIPWVASSPALTKLINWMYQEGDVLWDGTAGAVRAERLSGEGGGGVFHAQKAQDIINACNNLLKSGTLSAHDQQVARAIIQKLSDAKAGN